RIGHQGVLLRVRAARGAAAGGGGRLQRRPRRPGDGRTAALARRAGTAQPRAHLRRRRERDPARADGAEGPAPRAGAATRAGAGAEAEAARRAPPGGTPRRPARDPVNEPMVRSWVEALDDRNPVYVDRRSAEASVHGGPVAPPAMIQV